MSSGTADHLRSIVGIPNVLTRKEELLAYSFDGTAMLQQLPGVVVFVENAGQISAILKYANAERIPVVTRGSGTGLSGGQPFGHARPTTDSLPSRSRPGKIASAERNLEITPWRGDGGASRSDLVLRFGGHL